MNYNVVAAQKIGCVVVRGDADEQVAKALRHRAVEHKQPLHASNGQVLTSYLKERGLM